MKSIIVCLAFATLMTSANAVQVTSSQACPDLSGVYVGCTLGDEALDQLLDVSTQVTITQETLNGQNSYLLSDKEETLRFVPGLLTPYTTEVEGFKVEGDLSSKCEESALVVSLNLNSITKPADVDPETEETMISFITSILGKSQTSYKLTNDALTINDSSLDVPIICKKQ